MSTAKTREERMRTGGIVFAALVVLTLAEYWITTAVDHAFIWLAVIAVVKAWIILDSFMHIRQLRARED